MGFDPYRVLGLSRDASAAEVRTAYRALARKYHPDIDPGQEAAERFFELSEAYSVLSSEERRQRYARSGEPAGRRAPPAGAPPVEPAPRNVEVPRGGTQRTNRPEEPEPRPVDVQAPLEVDLGLAVRGGELRVTVPGGGPRLGVRLPAGTQDGTRVRLEGRGRAGLGRGKPGDLILVVSVRPHPYFQRMGDDLLLALPVTVVEALRGAQVEIPTPDGRVRVQVPPRCRGGERLLVRGRGVPRADGSRGDLHVLVTIRLPDQLDAATRTLERLQMLYREDIRGDLDL